MSDVQARSEEWIAEHARFLRRLARALLSDDQRAEDAAQDAWVAALEAPRPRNLVGWMVTVTRRVARRREREAARRRERERDAARPERLPAAAAVAARSEIVRRVGEVVSDLPEPFRETLLLRYWENLPPRAVAARMGVPVATVQSRTRRALARVQSELERRSPREPDWRESLALAVGRLDPLAVAGTVSAIPATLGVVTMKAKTWIVAAGALLVLAVAATVGVSISRPAPESRPVLANESPAPATPKLRTAARARQPAEPREEPPADRRPAAGAAETQVAAHTTLDVRVVDAAGGTVERAELLGGAAADELRVVGTTIGGRATLERTPELRVLCARAESWAPSPVYELPAPGTAADELVLQLLLRGAALAVEVRGPGGAPLEGARVFAGREEEIDVRLPDGALARTAPGFRSTTDASGVARFAALPPGWLRVRVEHDSFAATTVFATLERDREHRVEVELASGIAVVGRVRDDLGTPVAGARIRRGSAGRGVTSAIDGSFRLGPIGAGKVVAVGPLGRRTEQRLDGAPGAVVRWDPVLPSQPAVFGRVVDARGGPRAGWLVHANLDTWPGWRRGATTDPDGRFAIFDPPEGPLRIEVRDVADALPVLTHEGIEAGATELLLEVPDDPRARLVGRVVRSDGGPHAGLPLFLRHATTPDRERLTGGPGRALVADDAGHIDVDDAPAGRYELVLEGAPYGWYRLARFVLRAGRTTDVGTLPVPVPGVLRSRSWWGESEPTGDASYLLERRADRVRVLYFRGVFPDELRLAPGVYTLQTEVTPGPQRELEFEIRAGETTRIELDLAATCSHELRVRYASGRTPRGRLAVRVRRLDDGLELFAHTIANIEGGAWSEHLELPSGRFELFARDPTGLEVRSTQNLYTSRPGRTIALTLDDS